MKAKKMAPKNIAAKKSSKLGPKLESKSVSKSDKKQSTKGKLTTKSVKANKVTVIMKPKAEIAAAKSAKPLKAEPVKEKNKAGITAKSISEKFSKNVIASATEHLAVAVSTLVEKKKVRMTKSQELAQENLNKLIKKWQSLQTKTQNKGIKAEPYNMRKSFEARTPILHKVLGWGYIMNNINNRLEVLFKDGVRYLISNYK